METKEKIQEPINRTDKLKLRTNNLKCGKRELMIWERNSEEATRFCERMRENWEETWLNEAALHHRHWFLNFYCQWCLKHDHVLGCVLKKWSSIKWSNCHHNRVVQLTRPCFTYPSESSCINIAMNWAVFMPIFYLGRIVYYMSMYVNVFLSIRFFF